MNELDQLKPGELGACLLAERVLGVTAEAWDVNGRQGVVDALLTYADGTKAAFEITAYAPDGAIQIDAILAATENEWPSPGDWSWTIQVGSVRDIPELRRRYRHIAQVCERAGVERPEDLRYHGPRPVDRDVLWLVSESSSNMWGHSALPARREDGSVRGAMITRKGRGGGVDHSFGGMTAALALLFEDPNISRHVEKLRAANCPVSHLFLWVHSEAFSFAVADALVFGESIPTVAPDLPQGITHLWLAPQFGTRVLLGSADGWASYPFRESGEQR